MQMDRLLVMKELVKYLNHQRMLTILKNSEILSALLIHSKLNIVQSYLKMHCIRLYFDGDGSVGEYEGSYRVSFVGTKPFLEEIQSVLQTNYSYREKGNAYAFGTGGYDKVEELLNKLYRYATI